jgi:hypothetical protein
MFSAEDYLQGWIVYSIGASCLILFLWLLLRKSAWTTARHLTLLVSAAVLLTPVTAYRDDSHLAPAFFVSLYEGVMLSGAEAGFQRGLAPIIAVAVFALFFYLLIRLLWGFICRKRSGEKPVNKRLRGARLHAKQDPAT